MTNVSVQCEHQCSHRSEISRAEDLLSRVSTELSAAGFDRTTRDHEVDRLLEPPFPQSLYAEVLCLRVETRTVC